MSIPQTISDFINTCSIKQIENINKLCNLRKQYVEASQGSNYSYNQINSQLSSQSSNQSNNINIRKYSSGCPFGDDDCSDDHFCSKCTGKKPKRSCLRNGDCDSDSMCSVCADG